MKALKLIRLAARDDGTFGLLLVDNYPLFATLELPWRNNERSVSCIPPGLYTAKRTVNRTTTGGTFIPVTYEVQDVPDRSGILFHVGNYPKDTQGCILVGREFERGLRTMVVMSRLAFTEFMARMGDTGETTLEVVSACG